MIAARALTLAFALALTIVAPAAAQESRPPGWAEAPAPPCPRNAECGVLTAPLVDADPLGRDPHATYAFIRHTSKGPPLATVAYNPGGPGLSAIYWAKDMTEFLGPDMDLLLVDPRGVGASGALTCGIDDDIFIQPLDAQLEAVGECGQRLGDRADDYGTDDAADDLEAIRRRLGITKFDLYGQSYGTILMTTYARRYPASVRSMLLSGLYSFTSDAWLRDRAAGVRRAFRLLCARSANPCDGDQVLRDIARLGRQLRNDPIPFKLQWQFRQYPQQLSETELIYVVFNAAFDRNRLGRIPGIVREALDGRPGRLLRLAKRDVLSAASLSALSGTDSVVLRTALTCREGTLPYDPTADPADRREVYEQQRDALGRIEPFTADGWATGAGAGGILCLDWPDHEQPSADTGGYPKVPTLVGAGDLDWVTPAATGRRVAQRIPGARFVEVKNVGHVPELLDPTGCVGEIYWKFLHAHEVPDLTCLEHVPAVQVR